MITEVSAVFSQSCWLKPLLSFICEHSTDHLVPNATPDKECSGRISSLADRILELSCCQRPSIWCVSIITGYVCPKTKITVLTIPWTRLRLQPCLFTWCFDILPRYFVICVLGEEIGQLVSTYSLGFSFRWSHTTAYFEHRAFLV